VIFFKDRLSAIEINPLKLKIRAEFAKDASDLEKKANNIRKIVTVGGFVPATEPVIDFSQQGQRDFVLEAWGALKQIVFNACTVNRISVTQSTGILDAVGLLRAENIIGADIALLIKVLFNLGEKIANAKFLIPPESEARSYIRSAFFVVDWIQAIILTPPPPPPPPPEKEEKPPPPQTVVGDHYSQPQREQPAAWLIGIEGHVTGQRYPVDKAHYRIGSDAGNELWITGDGYVSGHHAYLSYQQGSLFLFDAGSRNGTFINEQQVTGTPNVVQQGDRIRVGESTFEVSMAPDSTGPSGPGTENGNETESGVRDPTWVP
jgi:hypothetical protein